jgi:hypothetical protein
MPFDLPPVTRALLIANIAIYLLQMLTGEALIVNFALWPLGASTYENVAGFQVWQVVTYGFLHGGFTHLAFNMLALWMFGGAIENLFGVNRRGIVFFDDMDLALRDRDKVAETEDQAVFLSAMDGITVNEGVVFVFSSSMFAIENAPTSQPARVYGTHGAGVFFCPSVIRLGSVSFTVTGSVQ